MKTKVLLAGIVSVGLVTASWAADGERDSMKLLHVKAVEVTSTRADEKTPIAYSLVGGDQIAGMNFGVDMPYLLLNTPSVTVTSDAGTGTGYTSLRVRGTDPSRINVTLNGIPINDAESSTTFWVNLPDMASSLADIQLQRGAGTSTNGAGAFGGSVNMTSDNMRPEPYAEVYASYGSFNTNKQTVKLGTGLVGKFTLDARLSNIKSDGYIRRAGVKLNSYFLQAAYYGRSTAVRFIHYTGKERTYHAWDGLTKEQMDEDRRYNPCGEILDGEGNVVGFYDGQTDNYLQKNFQLLVSQKLAERLSLNVNFHYTDGNGYYEEYKNGVNLEQYGLEYFDGVTRTDVVRRKAMDNGFGGAVFSLDYQTDRLKLAFGGGVNRYDGDHTGRVIWVKNYIGELRPDHVYYKNDARKDDANFYLKGDWNVSGKVSLYADLQYRHVRHRMDGPSDVWEGTQMRILDLDQSYNFFNPKVGAYFTLGRHNLYASMSVAHKEPRRDDFKYMKPGMPPKAERLYDYELGWKYSSRTLSLGANLYYMDYMNQLVQTGERNDIGEALSQNMPDSYRMGVELTAAVKIAPWLVWNGHATFSRNIIKDYTDYLDDYDPLTGEYAPYKDYIGDATIAYSPSVIAGSLFVFNHKGWSGSFQSNFVGKQYMNNAMSPEAELREYFVNNLSVGYTFTPKFMESITVGATVYNIFNAKYCNNGFAGRYMDSGEIASWAVYFPQATANVMFNLTLKL